MAKRTVKLVDITRMRRWGWTETYVMEYRGQRMLVERQSRLYPAMPSIYRILGVFLELEAA